MNRSIRPRIEALEPKWLLSAAPASADVQATLQTDSAEYVQGQPVRMTFSVTNISDHTVSLDDGPSIDGFEVFLGGKLVWSSNPGMQPNFVHSVSIAPGKTFTESAVWDGMGNNNADGKETPLAQPTGVFEVDTEFRKSMPQVVPAMITVDPESSSPTTPSNPPGPSNPPDSPSAPPTAQPQAQNTNTPTNTVTDTTNGANTNTAVRLGVLPIMQGTDAQPIMETSVTTQPKGNGPLHRLQMRRERALHLHLLQMMRQQARMAHRHQ